MYGRMPWIVPELLERCDSSTLYFDAVSQIEISRWSQGRVVVVGDASQCVSLLAGQGASLAMAGAYFVAQQLSIAGPNIGAALKEYERAIKPAIEKKQGAGRRLARWFVPNNRIQLTARDVVMRMANFCGARWLLKCLLAAESIVCA